MSTLVDYPRDNGRDNMVGFWSGNKLSEDATFSMIPLTAAFRKLTTTMALIGQGDDDKD